MDELPDELLINHVIPFLDINSKLQLGLVCNKYYELVKEDLKEAVKQQALRCMPISMNPDRGFAKTKTGEIVLFVPAIELPTDFEYIKKQYPECMVCCSSEYAATWDERGNNLSYLTWCWIQQFSIKPDVTKFSADMFQNLDGIWNEAIYGSEQTGWVVACFNVYDLYLVPDCWKDLKQWPSGWKDWKYLGRRSQKYFY